MSREKQIEEIAGCVLGGSAEYRLEVAELVYNKGHRKQSENTVDVVRCKDCTHYIEMKGYDYNGRKARSCIWHSQLRRENDYCSDGIRKGGAE